MDIYMTLAIASSAIFIGTWAWYIYNVTKSITQIEMRLQDMDNLLDSLAAKINAQDIRHTDAIDRVWSEVSEANAGYRVLTDVIEAERVKSDIAFFDEMIELSKKRIATYTDLRKKAVKVKGRKDAV